MLLLFFYFRLASLIFLAMGDYVGVVIGSIGSFLMILAYILLNFQRDLGRFGLNEDSILYNLLNFVGGALASASAIIAGTIGTYSCSVVCVRGGSSSPCLSCDGSQTATRWPCSKGCGALSASWGSCASGCLDGRGGLNKRMAHDTDDRTALCFLHLCFLFVCHVYISPLPESELVDRKNLTEEANEIERQQTRSHF